jgi:hypothetical protein
MKLAPFFLITFVMSLVASSIAASDNYALQFDGQNDYVACDTEKVKNLPERNAPRTEETWFKTEWPGPGLVTMMGYGNNYSNQMLNILVAEPMITISQWGARLDVNAPINDGEWYHIAVVHDGENMQTVYIDGGQTE